MFLIPIRNSAYYFKLGFKLDLLFTWIEIHDVFQPESSRYTGSVLRYLVVRLADADEEDEVCEEEADAEVQVDGGAGALDGTDQPEGQYADEEAD